MDWLLYIANGEFADIMLPEAYTDDDGRVFYRIGHSHQSY
jgi:hypothetical protein